MRTIVKISFIFSMLVCLSTYGQHKRGPLAQDNISDSRKEIKRDRSIHTAAVHAARTNEHAARKQHKIGVRLYHKPPKRKSNKETTVVVNDKKK
jgi:hypothetical protein